MIKTLSPMVSRAAGGRVGGHVLVARRLGADRRPSAVSDAGPSAVRPRSRRSRCDAAATASRSRCSKTMSSRSSTCRPSSWRPTLLDPAGKEGVALFTAQMLAEGTTTRSADQIANAAADLGTDVGATGFFTITRYFEPSLALMADQLLNPAFPQESIDRIRANAIAGLERLKDQPAYLARACWTTRSTAPAIPMRARRRRRASRRSRGPIWWRFTTTTTGRGTRPSWSLVT